MRKACSVGSSSATATPDNRHNTRGVAPILDEIGARRLGPVHAAHEKGAGTPACTGP